MNSFQDTPTVPFSKILEEADGMLSDSKNSIEKIFNTSKISDAFGDLQGIQKVVAIMILNILFPSLASKLKAFSPIPLNSFLTSLNILNFIKAVIKSGLTADVERGVIFVLGSVRGGVFAIFAFMGVGTLSSVCSDLDSAIAGHI